MDESILRKLADEALQTMNNHDAGGYAQLHTEDVVFKSPDTPEAIQGRQGIKDLMDGFFTAFPDMQVRFDLIHPSGEYLIVEGATLGTHTGPMVSPQGEIPPTGRSIELHWMVSARVTPEGLVSEFREYYDSAEMMKQLGLME